MSLDISSILSAVESHALASGQFERVNTHEPKNSPGNGVTCAIWAQRISTVPNGSGLSRTTARIIFTVRISCNMLQEPQDAIEPNIVAATSDLINRYQGDFQLGGSVRNVDIFGMAGIPMDAQAGYVTIGGTMYRVMTITLPLIVNDVWDQVG